MITASPTPAPRIGFIGAGRLASTLSKGLAQKGFAIIAVASRTHASAAQLAAAIPGCLAMDSPQAVADAAELVFISVTDRAIADVAAALRWRAGVAVVHCSGATEVSALASAAAQGALTTKLICRTFSDCTTAPRNGLISGCYPLDKYYTARPEFQKLKEIKKATGA